MQTSNPIVPIGNDLYLKVIGPFDDEDMIFNTIVEAIKDGPIPVEKVHKENLEDTIATFQIEDYGNRLMVGVFTREGQMVGIIMCLRSEGNVLFGDKLAVEQLWWVHKDYRKSKAGSKLLEAYEDWAKMVGCDTICLSNYGNSLSMDKMFNRKGYSKHEVSYIKGIN